MDYERARRAMVDNQLRTNNITDWRILKAMSLVPRERFLSPERKPLAYIDDVQSLGPLESKRFLAAPAPFARLIQLADIASTDRVLDIGAGTGYSCAVLARLGHDVTGLEADAALADEANRHLNELGVENAKVLHGRMQDAPEETFDVIVIEGSVEKAPDMVFPRLADDGRLVCLIAGNATGVAHVYRRTGDSVAGRAEFNLSLPPLEVLQREEDFVF
ncbi:protein-L-isoaspartate O-methyltransferase [Devosia pacifica]|uniref:Protein-L-isoaspartate O-methyltransferase n=1 Tax=Devosia pacifica TaxID=1335967 RepID=A0A918RUW3_9HYPH|nr:methyltransferase domain-containing protein [Devosia pacifica]GHA10902.1 protein-L-isoaspartate O-methyltransferase [Devosia pacifica]